LSVKKGRGGVRAEEPTREKAERIIWVLQQETLMKEIEKYNTPSLGRKEGGEPGKRHKRSRGGLSILLP